MNKVLSLENIKKIHSMPCSNQIKTFFEKGYGFELLMLLLEDYNQKPSLSVEKTLDKLSLHRPRREAFSRFINRLETNGCITKKIHTEKKSMRSLRLSDKLYGSIVNILSD